MPKTLTLSDLLKLQFSTLESLDRDTLFRLTPVLQKAQEDLRKELNKFSTESFSYIQKRQTLILINRALVKLYNQNLSEMEYMAEAFNEFGGEMANREVRDLSNEVGMSIPNIKKDLIALKHNEFLINTMKASLIKHSVGVRQTVSQGLTDSVIQKKTGYETVGRIAKYVDLKRWEVYRIVRTEMSSVFNRTKLLTYMEFNEDHFKGKLMKRMYHPMDNRTADDSKQWAKADPEIPLDKMFRKVITRKLKSGRVRKTVQEGLAPPLRPNDRAVLMPFYKKWKE